MSPIPVIVIGAGHLGKIHTRLLQGLSGFKTIAVADPNPVARSTIEKDYQLPTVEDYRMLEGEVTAAIVATPTCFHLETAVWCLEHGIHCFVEKPLVSSARQAELLVQIAHRRGLTLQVGHVERFNPVWQSLQPFLTQPLFIQAERTSTYTGRSTDIGVVLDLMVHDLDLIIQAIDSTVVSVQATGQSILGDHEDWAEAHLQFLNGAAARLYASRVSRTAKRTMHLFAEGMSAELDFAQRSCDLVTSCEAIREGNFRADRLPEAERRSVTQELFTTWLPHRSITAEPVNAIELELLDFEKAIRTSSKPQVDGQAARTVVEVAEQILAAIARSTRARDQAIEADHPPSVIPAAHRFGDARRAS